MYTHLGEDGSHPAIDRAMPHFAHTTVPMTFFTPPFQTTPDGAVVMIHHSHLADGAGASSGNSRLHWFDARVSVAHLSSPCTFPTPGRLLLPDTGSKSEGDDAVSSVTSHDVLLQQSLTGEQPVCPKQYL